MGPAERKQFAEMVGLATTLPQEFLICRLSGHAWEPVTPDREPPLGAPLICWECRRCTTRRYDSFDARWGALIARTYAYAERYLMHRTDGARGHQPLHRAAVRVAFSRKDSK